MSAYASLTAHYGRIERLQGAGQVLHWDMAAMMPKGGAEARAEQLAALNVVVHELRTAPELPEWLEAAAGESLDDWQRANLTEMRRGHAHATAVPADLVAALTRATSACEMSWRTKRAANDFAGLAPELEAVIDLVRAQAEAKSEALGLSPYEALLDEYEPGGRIADIDRIFDDLTGFLPEFTSEVLAHQAQGPDVLQPEGPFAIDAQRALGLRLMKTLGFDFDHGRLDVSHHPFCGGTPDDVRITTRYAEDDFTRGLMGVLHETGHALYERGLPKAWRHQPVGSARGMSVHESQSLLMEMQACRSPQFIHHLAPLLREAFSVDGPAYTEANLALLYRRVQRSLIRVDADEVTYPAHVILRYRLEQALLSGDLKVSDLPGAWREGMIELLGVAPDDDRDGCMQDVHWVAGIIGYFPTYTLGAMTAAQLFDAATTADADVIPGIARGDFSPLLGWVRTHIHQHGSRFSTDELLTRATGRPLDPNVFKAHLRQRYLGA